MCKLRKSRKPIVTAINGSVANVGVALSLAGDITIASDNAYFFEPFVKRYLRLGERFEHAKARDRSSPARSAPAAYKIRLPGALQPVN